MKTQTLEKQLSDLVKSRESIEKKENDLRKKIETEKAKNKPKSIMDRVKGMVDILKILGADKKKDIIKIDKFDKEEHEFLGFIVDKIRICKVYNEGKKLTKNDYRYYSWYNLSSGFAFDAANFDVTTANSASRLCVDTPEKSKDIFKKFPEIEESIILK